MKLLVARLALVSGLLLMAATANAAAPPAKPVNPFAPFTIGCTNPDLFGAKSGDDAISTLKSIADNYKFKPLAKHVDDETGDFMWEFASSKTYPTILPYVVTNEDTYLTGWGIGLVGDYQKDIVPELVALTERLDACGGRKSQSGMGSSVRFMWWIMPDNSIVVIAAVVDKIAGVRVVLPIPKKPDVHMGVSIT